ncbi:Esterase LovG [Paramyrothecium foliicola]|nr:Esterase LovG [Paramyrothecium foliicola]
MPDSSALHLPRILCLHGGGVNAEVFELQCRGIIARLRPYFRLVFVDAPFPCSPHKAIVNVFGDQGPFYRWLPWLSDHSEIDADVAAERILEAYQAGMRRDSAEHGATGPWVGVLGFSQGAKIAASLLWCQERAAAQGLVPLTSFRFGIIMAGSGPVLRLDRRLDPVRHIGEPGRLALSYDDWPADGRGEHAIAAPTLYVLGLLDPDVDAHRRLLRLYAKPGTVRLVEWEGDHRLPIKTPDVTAVVDRILEMAEDVDVI